MEQKTPLNTAPNAAQATPLPTQAEQNVAAPKPNNAHRPIMGEFDAVQTS